PDLFTYRLRHDGHIWHGEPVDVTHDVGMVERMPDRVSGDIHDNAYHGIRRNRSQARWLSREIDRGELRTQYVRPGESGQREDNPQQRLRPGRWSHMNR